MLKKLILFFCFINIILFIILIGTSEFSISIEHPSFYADFKYIEENLQKKSSDETLSFINEKFKKIKEHNGTDALEFIKNNLKSKSPNFEECIAQIKPITSRIERYYQYKEKSKHSNYLLLYLVVNSFLLTITAIIYHLKKNA